MYNEALTWIENALDSLHETGKWEVCIGERPTQRRIIEH